MNDNNRLNELYNLKYQDDLKGSFWIFLQVLSATASESRLKTKTCSS